jgi:hypothetical protein
MASAQTTRPPQSAERTDNDRRMFGFLREIRAACQYLQDRIGETLTQAAGMDAAARAAYVAGKLPRAVLDRVDQTVSPQLAAIQQLFTTDAAEFEWCADDVTRISLIWADAKDLWPAADATFERMDQSLKDLSGKLDQIVFQCASLTFSPRVNDIMCNLRTGQPLDVEFEFGKEFPKDPELRKRLIQELAQESTVIECGVVDVDEGVIYKAAPTRRQQMASTWRLAGMLLLGFLIPLALASAGRILDGWPLKITDLERLIVDYVLILVGSGAHLAVEALKSAKAQTRPSFQALNDWVLWVHVKSSQIRKGILYVWLGYILLAFGVPKLDWSSAFFAGYSIDSVTELFLERFQALAKTKASALAPAR